MLSVLVIEANEEEAIAVEISHASLVEIVKAKREPKSKRLYLTVEASGYSLYMLGQWVRLRMLENDLNDKK